MFHKTLRATFLTALIAAAFAAIPARASITFDGSGTTVYQQTQNNPCVIGDPSCNEPAGMTYTSNSGPGDYTFFSPVYTATSPFTTFSGNLIPTSFTIGIDSNIAAGAGLQVLQFFQVYSCTTTNVSSCTTLDSANSYSGPTTLPNNNNGNGYSDALLTGFSLTAGTKYAFRASVTNATDGMEEFFLIQTSSRPIPEPVTSGLIGTGLIGLYLLRRVRKA